MGFELFGESIVYLLKQDMGLLFAYMHFFLVISGGAVNELHILITGVVLFMSYRMHFDNCYISKPLIVEKVFFDFLVFTA